MQREGFSFSTLRGRLIRVTYKDGSEVLSKVGRVLFSTDSFITFRTRAGNIYIVNREAILSLKFRGDMDPYREEAERDE